ncbi:DUF2971 domain-containing protein [Photobacterium leiognathi]|uniref:DUF2971 domain-containing protein n=1 Tax=Photobacterium leiognathi TaxID=553611 RepID=UPI002982742B|nr:DUF2971 domain-containing protein [Photobacterium leiognathi]
MNYLYRYRSFNENTLRELIEGELWHSHVRNLNDPFEHPFDFDWDEITLDKLPNINNHLKLVPEDDFIFNYINEENRKQMFSAFKNWLNVQVKDLKKNSERTFICCFSESEDDPLMWSHYANGMTGLCFIYKKDILEKNPKLKFRNAVYNDSIEKITYRNLSTINKSNINTATYSFKTGCYMSTVSAGSELSNFNFAYQKHTRWGYEKEIRSVLFPENDEENAKSGIIELVGHNAIAGIIIGEKMNKTNRKIVYSISKEHNIPIHVAIANKRNYSVDINYFVLDPINF